MLRVAIPVLIGVLSCTTSTTLGGGAELPAPVKQQEELPSSYMGRVTAVTEKTITIKPEGHVQITRTRFSEAGKEELVSVYLQDNTKSPHTFVFNDELHYWNGTLPAERRAKGVTISPPDGRHKIADIQQGDIVAIDCRRIQGIDLCISLEIHRRPSGRVPPAIGHDKLPVEKQVATRRNAAQAREEMILRSLSHTFLRFRP